MIVVTLEAIGSRLPRGAVVICQWKRQRKRQIISRCSNELTKLACRNDSADAQCGFKAIKWGAAAALLPRVENDEWFFDTELLLLTEAEGYRIHEVRVAGVETSAAGDRPAPPSRERVEGRAATRRRPCFARHPVTSGPRRRPEAAWGRRMPDHPLGSPPRPPAANDRQDRSRETVDGIGAFDRCRQPMVR